MALTSLLYYVLGVAFLSGAVIAETNTRNTPCIEEGCGSEQEINGFLSNPPSSPEQHTLGQETFDEWTYFIFKTEPFDKPPAICSTMGAKLVVEDLSSSRFWQWKRTTECTKKCEHAKTNPVSREGMRCNCAHESCIQYEVMTENHIRTEDTCEWSYGFFCQHNSSHQTNTATTWRGQATKATTHASVELETTERLQSTNEKASGFPATSSTLKGMATTSPIRSAMTSMTSRGVETTEKTSGFPVTSSTLEDIPAIYPGYSDYQHSTNPIFTPVGVALTFLIGVIAGVIALLFLLCILHKAGKLSFTWNHNCCCHKVSERYRDDPKDTETTNLSVVCATGEKKWKSTENDQVYHDPCIDTYEPIKPVLSTGVKKDPYAGKDKIRKGRQNGNKASPSSPQDSPYEITDNYTSISSVQPEEHDYLQMDPTSKVSSLSPGNGGQTRHGVSNGVAIPTGTRGEHAGNGDYFVLERTTAGSNAYEYEKAMHPVPAAKSDESHEYFVIEKE